MKIQAWLSPQSDHFPTPRGFPTPKGTHFLEIPNLPSSPSTYTTEEDAKPEELDDDSTSESSASLPWHARSRNSVMTDGTEFDDIDDTSDDESPREPVVTSASSGTPPLQRSSSVRGGKSLASVNSAPRNPADNRRALPRLAIPTREDEIDLKKITSPVAPTPTLSATIPPDAMMFMQSQQDAEIPTAPPSLDGSLTSEQMAQMSAPPTPVIGASGDESSDEWAGVELQPGALATLHALSGSDDGFNEEDSHRQPEQVIEIPAEPAPEMQQQGLRLFTGVNNLNPPANIASPLSRRASFAGLTRLDIPSPGGFFADLSPRTRRTWDHPPRSPSPEIAPPTSTTAEQFYKTPWNADSTPALPLPPPPPRRPQQQQAATQITSSLPVEHIVDVQGPAEDEDPATARRVVGTPVTAFKTSSSNSGTLVEQTVEAMSTTADEGNPPTARRIPQTPTAPASAADAEPRNGDHDDSLKEIVVDYDPEYARKQQEVALSNLDRTELWLMAQKAYLKGIARLPEAKPKEGEGDDSLSPAQKEPATPNLEPETEAEEDPPGKKTVRFSKVVVKKDIPCNLPSKVSFHESAYYRAFQDYMIRSRSQDPFVHALPRLEAIQSQRVSLREHHRNQLLGRYRLKVVPQSAKQRMSANVARGDDVVLEDPAKVRAEKENEALMQMATSLWQVAASKALAGGKLIAAPVSKRLMRTASIAGHKTKDKPRILDLGGQAAAGWAWHVALQYPNAKIYTVTTKSARQLSNCNVRGPPNHRQVAVDRLTRLPFPSDHFDLVSARELHAILKYTGENGEDEWETCLAECMRVLKPGGYFDFWVLDSDIMKAGPLGLAKSVEFGFTLGRLGYDPSPTKLFLSRLARAGFEGTRRAWVFLPLGVPTPPPVPAKNSPPLRANPDGTEVNTHRMSAMVSGSTVSAAPLTALLGSLAWEKWLLRCEVEKVAGALRLADTVTDGAAVTEAGKCLEGLSAVVEEGRVCGAGFRVLSGYTRKPVGKSEGIIPIQLG